MDVRQAATWLGFTSGAVSIAIGVLILVLRRTRERARDTTARRLPQMTPGMLFSAGCMQLLSASTFVWPSLTILPLAVMMAGIITVAFALISGSPLFKQMLRRLDELS